MHIGPRCPGVRSDLKVSFLNISFLGPRKYLAKGELYPSVLLS